MAAKGSVLVVDDDPIVLEVTRARLVRGGWDVNVREHALGTAQWVAANRPDIVLLDVSMPALSGDALAEVLRRNGLANDVAIILHSGMALDELEALRLASGALGAIQKTGSDDAFLLEFDQLVATFLARRR